MSNDCDTLLGIADQLEAIERSSSANALHEFESSAVDVASAALTSGSVFQRRKALYIIHMLGGPSCLGIFSDVLARDASVLVRHEAAFYLGATRQHAAIEALARALTLDPEPIVRHEAAEALGDIGLRDALVALERARPDEDSVVRDTVSMAIDGLRATLSGAVVASPHARGAAALKKKPGC